MHCKLFKIIFFIFLNSFPCTKGTACLVCTGVLHCFPCPGAEQLRSAELTPGLGKGWEAEGHGQEPELCLAGAAEGTGAGAWLRPGLASPALCPQLPVAAQPGQVTARPACCGPCAAEPSLAPRRGCCCCWRALPCPRQAELPLLGAVLSPFSAMESRALRELLGSGALLVGTFAAHSSQGLTCPSSLVVAPLQLLLCLSSVPAPGPQSASRFLWCHLAENQVFSKQGSSAGFMVLL